MLGSALRCPHCGAGNPREQRVCLKCARSLSTEDAFASSTANTSSVPASYSVGTPSPPPAFGAPDSSASTPGMMPPAAPSVSAAYPTNSLYQTGIPAEPMVPTPLPMVANAYPIEDGAPYKTSGKVSAATAGKMLVATLLASVIVGVLWHFVGRFIDLVIIFPMLAGGVAGGIVTVIAKSGMSRSTKLALLCGLLVGPLTYGTKLVCNAYSVRPELVQGLSQSVTPSGATPAQKAQIEQKVEGLLTPMRTLRLYMVLMEETGVTLKSSHSSSGSGTRVSGNGYWVLLGVETLAVSLCALALLWSAASEPFCEGCQKWHGTSVVMQANPGQNPLIADAIRARNWGQFVGIQPGSWNNKAVTTVTLSRCEGCNGATLKTASTGKFPKDLKNIQLSRPNSEGLVGALQHAAETIQLPPVVRPNN